MIDAILATSKDVNGGTCQKQPCLFSPHLTAGETIESGKSLEGG
jgi:hypothetical protein